MKIPFLYHSIIILLFCSIFLTISKANAQWRLLGLENDTILSIAKDEFTDDGVIVGTKSSGIKIYNRGWYDISTIKLPVNDIFVTTSFTFIAAIGDGSNSDGFYSACAIDGPPYYVLGSMPFYGMLFPQSVSGKRKSSPESFQALLSVPLSGLWKKFEMSLLCPAIVKGGQVRHFHLFELCITRDITVRDSNLLGVGRS